MSDPDTRGILTDGDKAWLRDEADYEHTQSEANRRQMIRERVALAMQDFQLLVENWPAEEREKMLEEIDADQCAKDMIEFLYLALNERATDAERMINDDDAADLALAFRRSLCRGIRDAQAAFGDGPDTLLIDANTRLYELPSEGEVQQAIDTEDWRDANEYTRQAVNESDEAVIDKSEAARDHRLSLIEDIENELYHRRHQADTDIIRHDEYMGSSGL